jgi:enoyl-CoA hydratase/carnithine racemase
MSYVSTHDDGAVRTLTLDRPEARNALSIELVRALFTAMDRADADPDVRAVVLTGADPAFCAGVDLKEAAQLGDSYFATFRTQNCITKPADMTTPIIAAINGPTFTGGLEMALACDFIIASERAAFADTHARVGILPGGGMTARLPQVVGVAMARRLSMTGEVVDAARAERMGLVTEVVPHAQLLTRATELATAIAEVPPSTMAALSQMYRRGAATVIEPALSAEQEIARTVHSDTSGLAGRKDEVAARNKSQLNP